LAYLREVILQLSVDPSREFLESLLPGHWALGHPEHVLNHRVEESRENARRRDERRARRQRSS
jgi:transposase